MNINLSGSYNDLGYGQVTKHVLMALDELGHTPTYWPIGQPSLESNDEVPLLKKVIGNQSQYDVNAPSVRIWHQHSLGEFIGKGPRVGYPIFELDQFTPHEFHHLKNVDRLFVCSNWAKRVIEDNNIGVPTHVVPLGVNTKVFHPALPCKSDKTIFLNVGKFELRKGHDILIDAFNAAFKPSAQVELWMLTDNPFLSPEDTKKWHDLYKNSKLGDKVQFLERMQTHQEVAHLMNSVTCGVFPTKAEGWNLEALEMLACGKHLITTNYSGHTEFCNDKNSLLIQINELETAYDGIWFHGEHGQWASFGVPQFDQLVSHMRAVHVKNQSGQLDINQAGLDTAKLFTWSNTASTIVSHLEN